MHLCDSPFWNHTLDVYIVSPVLTWKRLKSDPNYLLQSFGILHAMNPDPYRGAFGNDGSKYAADLKDLIMTASSGLVAGFMAETIQGVGGALPLASGYLPEAYKVSAGDVWN